jgi:hypothetical protein
MMDGWTSTATAEDLATASGYDSSDITISGLETRLEEIEDWIGKIYVYSGHTEFTGTGFLTTAKSRLGDSWEDMFLYANDDVLENEINTWYDTFSTDDSSGAVSGYADYDGTQYFASDAADLMMELGTYWMEYIKLIWPNSTENGGSIEIT